MNNQKDNQKTGLNSYGHNNVLDVKSLNSKHIYEFANKKTEKLVTALYMVTDCMDTEDALKAKLRELGVELLSDMYKVGSLSPIDRHTHISTSIARVDEILSFVEISCTIGFISEMNTSILKKEFLTLIGELESHLVKDKHFTFTLDQEMFSIPTLLEDTSAKQSQMERNSIKDKRKNFNTMSFTKSGFGSSSQHTPHTAKHVSSVSDKTDRTAKILSLVSGKDVSIRDISTAFTDCSEKTIQRELNALVSKGQIKKTGSKRWSRYQLVTSS